MVWEPEDWNRMLGYYSMSDYDIARNECNVVGPFVA